MKRGQTCLPRQWLVADERLGENLWRAVEALPIGSGVLVLYRSLAKGRRASVLARLRRIARSRSLLLVDEAAGRSARVHNPREIRNARLRGVKTLFLSPLHATRSHPEWKPLPRMRAASLARLAGAPVIALGGMDARRFRRIEPLGFHGWAGIDAYR